MRCTLTDIPKAGQIWPDTSHGESLCAVSHILQHSCLMGGRCCGCKFTMQIYLWGLYFKSPSISRNLPDEICYECSEGVVIYRYIKDISLDLDALNRAIIPLSAFKIQPSTLSRMVAVINGVWGKIFHWQSSGIFPPGDELWLQLPQPNPAESTAKQGREMAPRVLIKLCQLKALLLFFPGRFEIQNSPLPSLSLWDHGEALSNAIIIWSSDF